jgi:hypothetical protein
MTAHHIGSYLPAMSHPSAGQSRGPGRYEVRVKGRLEARWAAWFDGMTLTAEDDGVTCIHGPVIDQAALHGLLAKLRDVGLPLISVIHAEPDQPGTATSQPR